MVIVIVLTCTKEEAPHRYGNGDFGIIFARNPLNGEIHSFLTIFSFFILSNKLSHGCVMPLFPLEGYIVLIIELHARIMQVSLSLYNYKLPRGIVVFFLWFGSWYLPI